MRGFELKDIAEIKTFVEAERARCEAAHAGQWFWSGFQYDTATVIDGVIRTDIPMNPAGHDQIMAFKVARENDLDFIANARTALPQALDYLAELLAEREARHG